MVAIVTRPSRQMDVRSFLSYGRYHFAKRTLPWRLISNKKRIILERKRGIGYRNKEPMDDDFSFLLSSPFHFGSFSRLTSASPDHRRCRVSCELPSAVLCALCDVRYAPCVVLCIVCCVRCVRVCRACRGCGSCACTRVHESDSRGSPPPPRHVAKTTLRRRRIRYTWTHYPRAPRAHPHTCIPRNNVSFSRLHLRFPLFGLLLLLLLRLLLRLPMPRAARPNRNQSHPTRGPPAGPRPRSAMPRPFQTRHATTELRARRCHGRRRQECSSRWER